MTEQLEEKQELTSVKRRLSDISQPSTFKKSRPDAHPRWHNQAYMLFLALRQHPDQCLPRGELIKEALRLDEKLSSELNLPRAFTGKTPGNSASASLTINSDRYFIPFKPEGSRSTWFKLAYEPGNEEKAVQEYQKWLTKLAEHDWPYCFGIPKVPKEPKRAEEYQTPPGSETESAESYNTLISEPVQTLSPESVEEKTANEKKTIEKSDLPKLNQPKPEMPVYTLDELDLAHVPKSLAEIVYVSPSGIPGAGSGLFAKQMLPYNTPIGFYFGVPMTEDEYDSLKDRVGRSSEYSIMYRKTVLDATDKEGEPVTEEASSRYCPFHFMNETDEEKANVLFVEGVVVNQVICWTRRDISPDEELLVWYGRDVDRHWGTEKR